MNGILSFVKNLMVVSSVLIFFTALCSAQNKVDLEVTAQTESETARGGETFSFTVTVKNTGSAKATDVILLQSGNFGEASALSSAGTCALFTESQQMQTPFRCLLGDIQQGESVIINFSIKLMDFGGEEEDNVYQSPVSLPSIELSEEDKANWSKRTIANINVASVENEDNRENNSAEIRAEILASKNKPPRIQIISPKNYPVITKQVNKQIELKLTIKAFDTDGTIEKVVVDDPEYSWRIVEEDGQYKYWYEGKTFTVQEFDEYVRTNKLKERLATKTGENTYTYIIRNPRFIYNRVHVYAVDDGGRSRFVTAEFTVEGDAKLEIVSPKKDQVFAPNSTIKIETVSKINDPALSDVRLLGTPKDFDKYLPVLQQISKVGNVFKNQYIWKNVPEGVYRLKAVIMNDLIPINYSEQIKIVVAEPRIVKIVSLKNGQEFEEDKPIMLRVEATDIKGKMVYDTLEIMIDGKTVGKVSNSWTTETTSPFKQINDPARQFDLLKMKSLEKGVHTIQIIAKEGALESEDKAILGQSEIITIKIK